jgi:hypothetical protein
MTIVRDTARARKLLPVPAGQVSRLLARGTAAKQSQMSVSRYGYSVAINGAVRLADSAQGVTGQSVDPRLVFLSVQESPSLGHGYDRLAYPEAALLKIVSK